MSNDWRHQRAADRADAVATCYLGDGVYAAFDGYGVWLTAEDGIRATDGIYVEPQVYRALTEFVAARLHRAPSAVGHDVADGEAPDPQGASGPQS